MSFFRRLIFYLFGVSLGLLLSYAFFSERPYTCNYLPNDRVLSYLRNQELSFSEDAMLNFKLLKLDTNQIVNILHQGNVNFANSDTKNKTYEVNSSLLNVIFLVRNDTTIILNIW